MTYWYKGALHEGGVTLGVDSPAFRYGAGFFETLLWNGAEPWLPDAHIARLEGSLARFSVDYQPCDYPAVIAHVVEACGLHDTTARINILVPIEDADAAASPLVLAAPWTPPRPDATRTLRLASQPAQSPLGMHKSMNYLGNWLERRAALRDGYDDVVVTLPGNLVLETTTAALLFSDGTNFCAPAGLTRLRSTTLDAARTVLPVHDCTIRVAELFSFRHAYMLNALVGMLPVRAIGTHAYDVDAAPCARLRPLLLGLHD